MSLRLWRNAWRCLTLSFPWWGSGWLPFGVSFQSSNSSVFDACAFGLWRIHNWFECFGRWNDVRWWYEMGMRVGFEEILDLKHFWDRLGGRLREEVGDETVGFWKNWTVSRFKRQRDSNLRKRDSNPQKKDSNRLLIILKFLGFLQRDSNPRKRDSNRLKTIKLLEIGFESLKQGFESPKNVLATGK